MSIPPFYNFFSQDQLTAACFIAIDGAYNNIDISCVTTTLDRLGVGARICKYLWSFLSDRDLTVSTLDRDLVRSTGRGLAQGCPLSPLLLNVATLNICSSIENVEISQYADDFVLYVTRRNLESALTE